MIVGVGLAAGAGTLPRGRNSSRRSLKRVSSRHDKQRAKRQRQRRERRRRARDPLIGVFAYCGLSALCDGDACLIAGSHANMQRYMQQAGRDASQYTVQATSFSEILAGLQAGAAYAFDEEAYGCFLGPAQAAGLPLGTEDFSEPASGGLQFVRVGYLRR